MKRYIGEFFRRGLLACGLGPVLLAVVYLILHHQGALQVLTVAEVCRGIFSLTALAFIAGSMNVIYQLERLPLMAAILVHGCVLYIGYLAAYLINGWLQAGSTPILIFTVVFILGYLAIWAVIYSATKRNTDRINQALKQKQQKACK